jgi:hypothetical protein
MRSVLMTAMRYVGYPAGRALAIYGQVFGPLVPPPYFPLPPEQWEPREPKQRPRTRLRTALRTAPQRPVALVWDGPPPGHPERLRPDVPLSRVERDLLRRLGAEPRRRG